MNYVDLDLDVTVRPGGCVELLDSDEFEAHKQKYRYPSDIVDRARAAAGEVSSLALRQAFPFDQTCNG